MLQGAPLAKAVEGGALMARWRRIGDLGRCKNDLAFQLSRTFKG